MDGDDRRRLERAATQRIYLVGIQDAGRFRRDYDIMGASDRLYTVTVAKVLRCTCPDFENRRRSCKHIMFVFERVLRRPGQWRDLTRSREDVAALLEAAIPVEAIPVVVRGAPTRRPIAYGTDECPICYEPFEEGERTVWCRRGCGNSVHALCMGKWLGRRQRTCVWCRTAWV